MSTMCTVPVKVSVGCREAVSGLCEARMSCMVAGWSSSASKWYARNDQL